MDFKPPLLTFSFPPRPSPSLSSDHPGTRLLIFLVSCCSLQHESLHDRELSCQGQGLVRPLSPKPCFPTETFHSKGNEVTHHSTRVTGEKIPVPGSGCQKKMGGAGPSHTQTAGEPPAPLEGCVGSGYTQLKNNRFLF